MNHFSAENLIDEQISTRLARTVSSKNQNDLQPIGCPHSRCLSAMIALRCTLSDESGVTLGLDMLKIMTKFSGLVTPTCKTIEVVALDPQLG